MQLPELPVCQRAIAPGHHIARIDLNRPAVQLHCPSRIACLKGDRSEQIERIGVRGLLPQYLLVNRLRLRQLPRLM